MQAWCTGWWNAEREEALRQLDDILDAEAAWQPAPALWGSAPSDSLEEPSAEDDDDEPGYAVLLCPEPARTPVPSALQHRFRKDFRVNNDLQAPLPYAKASCRGYVKRTETGAAPDLVKQVDERCFWCAEQDV